MEHLAAITHEGQTVADGGRTAAVSRQRIGPHLTGFSNVAGLGGVNARKPRLVLAPPDVAAYGHVQTVVEEHRRAHDAARAFVTVAHVAVHVLFGGPRITVETPNSFERLHRIGRLRRLESSEGITDAVPAAEEHQPLSTDDAQGRSGPGAVEDPGPDAFAILSHQPARCLVEYDQAGRVRCRDSLVAPVDTVTGVEIEIVSVEENGGVSRIVRVHADLGRHVVQPKDIRVDVGDLGGGFPGWHHVAPFIQIGPVITVGLALQVQADDFRPVGDDVHAIAFDGGRGTDPRPGPIQIEIASEFRHHQLPLQPARSLIQTEKDATIALMPRVSRLAVVGTDHHVPLGDDRRGIRLRSHRGRPLDVLARGRVETIGQSDLIRDHIPREPLPPLRTVLGPRRDARCSSQQPWDGRRRVQVCFLRHCCLSRIHGFQRDPPTL